MNEDSVVQYLRENPAFFEDHAELLTQIFVAHPHGGKAIPLSDRQVIALRDENKAYRGKLSELIKFGEENVAISDKMHRLAQALLPARDLASLLNAFYYNLSEDFAVPHTAIRLWRDFGGDGADRPEFSPVSAEIMDYALGLTQPYCGPSGNVEAAAWFGEAASHVRSVAHVALMQPQSAGSTEAARCFGMLAMGSEDVMRFYPDMGTLYLKRLGDFLGAGVLRFI